MRRALVSVWVYVGLAAGCSSANEGVPKKPPGSGTDGSGPNSTSITGGGTGGDPACEAPGGGGETDTDGGGGTGFKFDVGAADDGGFDFPVTCEELETSRSNLGCEFWAVDLPNDWRGTDFSGPAGDQQFAVVVANASALQPAMVAVYVGASADPMDQVEVDVDTTHTFELPPQSIDPEANSTNGVAYRIESDIPITAYQFNPLDNTVPVYSNDASVLLPSHAMAMDYAAVTGDAVLLAKSGDDPNPVKAGAFVSVVGISDGTVVDMFPSVPAYAGPTEGVAIDRGQVFTVLSDLAESHGNLSGTRVLADKPVAVFSGNVATVEPISAMACCADHLEQQMLPIESWGTGYAVAPPPGAKHSGNDPAMVRITGAFDDTELAYCPFHPPGAPSKIDAFQSFKFEADFPFVVRALDPDKPFSVAQFLESTEALPGSGINHGDPALVVIPPAAQFQFKYVFAVPEGYSGGNYVSVVSKGKPGLQLDGMPVDGANYDEVGVLDGHMYHFQHVEVGQGAHLLESTSPVGITVVGYDEAVSYGYAGGAGLNVIAVPPAQG